MSIQKKFNLYVSELDQKLSDLLEEEVSKDMVILNNLLDISQSYQDETGLNFSFTIRYGVNMVPIRFVNGTYEFDRSMKIAFSSMKDLFRQVDRGWVNLNVDLDSKKAKFGPEFQRQIDRFKNNILKFYPGFNISIVKYSMHINYNRNEEA